MRQRILIDNSLHELEWLSTTRAGQLLLEQLHKTKRRPLCNCVPGGVEMYVAQRGSLFYVSRMPGSGVLHDPSCESVEDTNYLTGTTAYTPDVITERSDGSLVVAYGKLTQRTPPLPTMSIAGLLDLLLEQANLNRYSHREGQEKLTWAATRNRLLGAAEGILFRHNLHALINHLAIPASFDKDSSTQEQAQFETALRTTPQALICAPFKEMRKTTYGRLLVLKHLSNLRFWVTEEVSAAAEAMSHSLFRMDRAPRYALCLGEVKPAKSEGSFTVTSLSIRTTDVAFMPCANDHEAEVSGKLRSEGASFVRPMRFDAPADMALADYALLNDEMTPIFVRTPTGNAEMDAARRALVAMFERNRTQVRIIT